MTTGFDAVTLEVLWTQRISVVDEAAKAIVRTSFSTLGTLPATVRHFLRDMGAPRMHPGDVLITNDPAAWAPRP